MTANTPPFVFNVDNVFASAGADPIALRIESPLDADGDTMTITLGTLPTYGTVEYFDGTDWVVATAGLTLTDAELQSLRYTPPAIGEFGGESITYHVDDGTDTTDGVIAIHVEQGSAGTSGLIFSAASSNGGNSDLYTVAPDGTLTAIPLNDPNGSFGGIDGGYFQFAGNLYFNAASAATSGDTALFKMAPGGAVTPVDDGAGGFYQSTGESAHFTEFDGSLYFRAISAAGGDQLVKLNADGSSSTIVLHNGGQQAFAGENGGFTEFDGKLYFSAFTDTSGPSGPDLIALSPNGSFTDISTRSTPGAASFAGEDGGFFAFNGTLYFNAYSETLGGDTLFSLAAGSTAPVEVDPTGTTLTHTIGTQAAFHIFNGAMLFTENDVAAGSTNLFQMDPNGSIQDLAWFDPGVGGDVPLENAGAFGGFVDFAGATFFTAHTADTGTELFALDANGDVSEIDINPGLADAFDGNLVSGFVVFNGALYFDAYDSSGDNLYRLSPDGFLDTVDLGVTGTVNAGVEGGFQVANGSLYFSAYTPHGYELVKLDADGTVTNTDINPGAGNSEPGKDGGFAVFPMTILNGHNGNDILAGGPLNETLNGGPGDDVLIGGGGNDILTGGDGINTFVFAQAGDANVDTITDYKLTFDPLSSGDTIDLSALLDANFIAGSNISDFVRVAAADGNLVIQVDADGTANGARWKDVAILQGAEGDPFDPNGGDTVKVHFNSTDYLVSTTDAAGLHVTALSDGGWVVAWDQSAWQEVPVPDTFYTVYANIYDASGQQVGSTIQVSDPNSAMPDDNSIVTALANGRFAVTWEDCLDELQTRVYDSSGNDISGVQFVNDLLGDDSRALSQVVALNGGGYAVLWQGNDGSNDTVYVNTFDDDGNEVSGQFAVPVPGDDNNLTGDSFGNVAYQDRTAIVALANGFAVTWVSERDDGGGNIHPNAYVAVFQNDGTPVTGEVQVNGADDAIADAPVDIVALGGDNFSVQWQSLDSVNGPEVFTRLFNSTDYNAGAAVRNDANSDPGIISLAWHLLGLAGGGYVSLWEQSDFSTGDVYVQVRDASGAIAAGSQAGGTVVNEVAGASLPDEMVALTGGGFAVMFDSYRDDGFGSGPDADAFIRAYAADGTPLSGEIQLNDTDAEDDFGIQLIALPNGTFTALWVNEEINTNGSDEHLYARNFAADGTPLGGTVDLGSSPADATAAQDESLISEFRAAVRTNGALLVAAINSDTFDLTNFFEGLGVTFGPSAHDDGFTTGALTAITGQSVFFDHGNGDDTGALFAATVNGDPNAIGTQITLSSGALLTLNEDGTFTYDPGTTFDTLAAPGSGAANTTATDTFTYSLAGGSSATVTVHIDGVNNPHTIYMGGAGSDTITGDPTIADLFDLSQGGSDTATGGAGNDGFKLGGAFDATDHIDGGGGTNNQAQFDGAYAGTITLSGAQLTNIQVAAFVDGHNYTVVTQDSLVPAGQTFTFWSVSMGSGNHVNIDGSAETDGRFKFFLGQGDDIAKGGAGADLFYGEGGHDTLTGGGGADIFAYLAASDSKGSSYDTITDFTVGTDKLDLPVTVSSIAATLNSGFLSAGSVDSDLASQIGPDEMPNGSALLFKPDSGDLAGHTFLIVDADGLPGYSSGGGDFVFDVTGGINLNALSTSAFV